MSAHVSVRTPIRVVIADVYPVMRVGLVTTIEADADMQVVATPTHRRDLIPQLRVARGDVLVINLVDMGDAPVSLLQEIKQQYPQLSIVVFAAVVDFAPELLAAGVKAYISYEEPDQQLHLAIRAAKAGTRYLSPLVQEYMDRCTGLSVRHRFAPRELEIIKCITQGVGSTKEIADRLGMELGTLQNYIWSIRRKTGWTSWPQMASWYTTMYGSEGSRSTPLSGRT